MRFFDAIAACVLLAAAPTLSSCPFCVKLGRTISDQVAEANWVGFVRPSLTQNGQLERVGAAANKTHAAIASKIGRASCRERV